MNIYTDKKSTCELYMMVTGTNNPADATTYFIGTNGVFNTTESQKQFISIVTGTITDVMVWINGSGAGTSEGVTLKVRNVTQATTTTLTSSANWSSFPYSTRFTGLSISVTAGDEISFQIDTPTWVTNPTGISGTICYLLRN